MAFSDYVRTALTSPKEQTLTIRSQPLTDFASIFDRHDNYSQFIRASSAQASTLLAGEGLAADPGNTPGSAHNLGVLSGTQVVGDRVSSTDPNDYYRFTLSGSSDFNLALTGMAADADVELLSSSGAIIAGSYRGSNGDESINREGLAAGTYYVRVYRFSGNTPYRLTLSTNGISNLLPREVDLGNLSTPQTHSGVISSTNTADIYRFSLTTASSFNLGISGLSADTDVRLIRDINSNGRIDLDEVLASSTRSSSADEAINLAQLDAGNYFVQVYQHSGDTAYSLRLSTGSSNLLPAEIQVGALNGTRRFSGSVGNSNTADVYQFNLAALTNFDLTMTGLSADADVRLIQDANSNGILDPTEILNSSTWGGIHSEGLRQTLNAGTYFVQIYQFSGETNYSLSLSIGDWYSQHLTDFGVIGLARDYLADNYLSRNEMMALFRETEDEGSISTDEVTDLRMFFNGFSSQMPDYVRILSNRVINPTDANIRSGIGNLAGGAASSQMEQLIGKWFLGNDRPDVPPNPNGNARGYRYLSGALFQTGISYNDIDQGGLGDCYFLASLAGTACQSPEVIQNMFIDNGDDTYTVRFYNGSEVDYITVDRYLPVDVVTGHLLYAGRDSGLSYSSPDNELWVLLAEKAYAQLNEIGWLGRGSNTSSYPAIEGGSMSAISHITGRNTSGYRSLSADGLDTVVDMFYNGRIIYLSTGGHALTITDYDAMTQQFTVYNPWGSSDTRQYTWSEMVNTFVGGWGYSLS
ncbi:pre-peptidase C-terminal domain-containing protein [Pantanalinema rosaneae CENA516]|uniref:pre-peptidase C-terminal domain-containing protein n=1 Tax=Pantanalinema rosaneae TaxID=1620701 RepID=UPI003D6DF778